METTQVEPTVTYKPEDFAAEYQKLCDKMGYRIVVSPQWIARDDGSFSMIQQYTVGKIALPVEQK